MGLEDIPNFPFTPFALSTLNRCWTLTLPQQRKVWEHLRTDQSLISILKHFKDKAMKMNRRDILRIFDELTWTVMMMFEEQFHFLFGKKEADVKGSSSRKEQAEIPVAPINDDRVDSYRKRAELLFDKLQEKEQALAKCELESKAEISRLNDAHEQTRVALQDAEHERSEMLQKLAELEAQLLALKESVAEAQQGRTTAEDMAANLTSQLNAEMTQNRETNQAMEAAEQRIRELTALLDAARDKHNLTLQELRDKEAERDGLYQEMQRQAAALREDEMKRFSSIQGNQLQFQGEVDARRREIEHLMQSNRGLEENLQGARDEIGELTSAQQALEAKNGEAQALIQQLQAKLDAKPEKTIVQDRSGIEKLTRRIVEFEVKVGKDEVEIHRLQLLVSKLMAECSKKGHMSTIFSEEEAMTIQQAFRMKNVFNRLYEDALARHGRNAERLQRYINEQMEVFDKIARGRMFITFRVQRYAFGDDTQGGYDLVFDQVDEQVDGTVPYWIFPKSSVESVVVREGKLDVHHIASAGRSTRRIPPDRPQSAGDFGRKQRVMRGQHRQNQIIRPTSAITLRSALRSPANSRSEAMMSCINPSVPTRTVCRNC